MTNICPVCNAFPIPESRLRRHAKTCSPSCTVAKHNGCRPKRLDPKPALCRRCQTPIPLQRLRHHAKTCSLRCTTRHHNTQRIYLSTRLDLPAPTVGALAELVVGADLMRRGYEVFRSLSPAASCDLAILGPEGLRRVEVRTAYRTKHGVQVKTNGRYDLFAAVIHCENLIIYTPPLEDLGVTPSGAKAVGLPGQSSMPPQHP